MQQNIFDLRDHFYKIKSLGWIRGISNGTGNVGITFESLLGKQRENFSIPDYQGIEIKTSLSSQHSWITLFSASPDGAYLFETRLLCDRYGCPDPVLKEHKIFYKMIRADKIRRINKKYLMKLSVVYATEKIFLEVYDNFFHLIERECFWNFSSLEERLFRKLRYLAFIKAEKKVVNTNTYFRYTDISFYQLKDFRNFLILIENGEIQICFKVGVFRSEKKMGKICDHGTGFQMKEDYLLKLYSPL